MPAFRRFNLARIRWSEGDPQVCDCGHAHLGWYFCCSQCARTFCLPCWSRCSYVTTRRMLVANVPDETSWGQVVHINTCKICGDIGMGEGKGMDRCPPSCAGRQKWVCMSSFGRLRIQHAEPGACDCATCRRPKPFEISWDDDRLVSTLMPRCQALRKRVVLAMRSQHFIDEECCMGCFRHMFWQIGMVAVNLTDRSLPAPVGEAEPWYAWRILFRASKRSWAEEKIAPPRHYIDSLEEGTKVAQLACCHVGRYWSCHPDGHPCGCLSTSILAWEALRRLEADMSLQIIFVPTHCWERVATDLSSPEAVRRLANFNRFCAAFSIRPKDVTKYSYLFREVVLDKRQVVSDGPPPLDFCVFEVQPDNETVKHAKACCRAANDVMHQASGRFLEAENHARNALVNLATPSFESWLRSRRPPPAPMPVRPHDGWV